MAMDCSSWRKYCNTQCSSRTTIHRSTCVCIDGGCLSALFSLFGINHLVTKENGAKTTSSKCVRKIYWCSLLGGDCMPKSSNSNVSDHTTCAFNAKSFHLKINTIEKTWNVSFWWDCVVSHNQLINFSTSDALKINAKSTKCIATQNRGKRFMRTKKISRLNRVWALFI